MKLPRPRIGPRTGVLLVLVALVGVEFGLSFAGFGRVAAAEADPVLGWRKIPGQSGEGRRGEAVSINSDGFRDRDWARPRAEPVSVLEGGTRGTRVAVLGDSVSFGAGVEVQHMWTRRFEKAARAAADGENVLVMNLALPGYTFEQMARSYEAVARAYRPDIVVVAVNPYSVRPMRPPLEAKDYPLRRFVERTAIWDYLQRNVLRDHGLQAAEREDIGLAEETAAVDALVEGVLHDPYGAAAAPLWADIEARLAELHAAVRTDGGRLVVVALPRFEEVLQPKAARAAERWAELVAPLDDALFVDPFPQFRASMAALLAELRAADVKPRLVWRHAGRRARVGDFTHKSDTLFFFSDPGHYTPRGHAVLAEAVRAALQDARWIP